MKKEHVAAIDMAVDAVKAKKNINHIYFVACGGSLAFMMPAQYIFDRELDIPSSWYPSNEFVYRAPKALGPDSVVITCSHSGNTPETVKATEIARQNYDWGKDADASDINKGVLYLLIFKLLNVLSPDRKWEKAIASVDALGSAIEKAKNQYKDTVREWGRKYKREKLIYTMGSGASYGEAYSFSICLLMEMQWINSSCIHTGEYFHGPFEITDYDVPFIIILGRGATRHLDERAYSFCRKYSDEIMLVDESTFDMSGIDEEVQPYFASILSGVVLRTLADELAYQRGHDLSVRRYMWRMEY